MPIVSGCIKLSYKDERALDTLYLTITIAILNNIYIGAVGLLATVADAVPTFVKGSAVEHPTSAPVVDVHLELVNGHIVPDFGIDAEHTSPGAIIR